MSMINLIESSIPESGSQTESVSASAAKASGLTLKELWLKYRPMVIMLGSFAGFFSAKIAQGILDFVDGMNAAIK